ncbi:helix-turn-helix transcriptional regulator [Pseudoalteromonas luteoviolacea]|uniref:helix-turn-helix domain-containing protein n=1 Tax=Pseudoalteromonas luteoviolacea TaxID=43657 RepID=UPI001B39160C|nr:helix-turn-helix transcriptional regulator [Pseudoalteromonas luteoviolacea]MBQ4811287.1 helix-turn-helix transcriptional regulator [Pseudoalteromonas luteoviolacea]
MINKAVRLFRQYNELTQSEVAETLCVSKSHLNDIELGKKPITPELLEKYSQIFDLPVSSLVFFSETLDRKEKKVPKKFRRFVSDKVLRIMEWLIEREEKSKIKA